MRAHVNLSCFVSLLLGVTLPVVWRPYVFAIAVAGIVWWGSALLLRRLSKTPVFWLPILAACVMTACAASDKGTVYTEEGLRAAEQGWDTNYNAQATHCAKLHEPKTPEMEECFGRTYDVDAAIGVAVESAVALLQGYWRRRAAGEKPDLAQVLKEVQALVDGLPPEAKEYFDRVRGL